MENSEKKRKGYCKCFVTECYTCFPMVDEARTVEEGNTGRWNEKGPMEREKLSMQNSCFSMADEPSMGSRRWEVDYQESMGSEMRRKW